VPFTMVVGNYATSRGINKNGLRRRGFSDEAIADAKFVIEAIVTFVKQTYQLQV
nr:acyl-[acyl-carrier-protein]--UDP-N-acetylglucosamine O-acyltransferase [Anaerolineae bacterium]